MELELVSIASKLGDDGFCLPFIILVPKGESFDKIMERHRIVLNDDDFFKTALEEYYEYGRVEFAQEDAYVLGLTVGSML